MSQRLYAGKPELQEYVGLAESRLAWLPPLQSTVAVACLTRLAAAIRRCSPRGTGALVRAVADIQLLVAESVATTADSSSDSWEPVFDVCFYGIDDWDGRLT